MAINEERLNEFLHKFVGDLGATMGAGSVVIGDRLGLYHALAGKPMLPQQLAARTDTTPRYVEEWLRGQAAGGYVEYNADTGEYSLTEEQAFALTNPDGPVFAPGAFQLASARSRPSRRSAGHSRPARASAGTSTATTCSPDASGSSGPDTAPTWSAAGCPR